MPKFATSLIGIKMGNWIKYIVALVFVLLLAAEGRALDMHNVLSPSEMIPAAGESAAFQSPEDTAEKTLDFLLSVRLAAFSQPVMGGLFFGFNSMKWAFRAGVVHAAWFGFHAWGISSVLSAYPPSVFLGRVSSYYLYRLRHLLI